MHILMIPGTSRSLVLAHQDSTRGPQKGSTLATLPHLTGALGIRHYPSWHYPAGPALIGATAGCKAQ